MAPAPKTPVVTTLRMLVGAVVGALFLMAVALMFVLGFGAPAVWAVVALLLLGVGMHFLLERVGYRVTPIPPSLPAEDPNLNCTE